MTREDQADHLLLAIGAELMDNNCRCMPNNPRTAHNGATVCDRFACPRINGPTLARIAQFLGGGDERMGYDAINIHAAAERRDDHGTREIIALLGGVPAAPQ